jgi:hypothetical protein
MNTSVISSRVSLLATKKVPSIWTREMKMYGFIRDTKSLSKEQWKALFPKLTPETVASKQHPSQVVHQEKPISSKKDLPRKIQTDRTKKDSL